MFSSNIEMNRNKCVFCKEVAEREYKRQTYCWSCLAGLLYSLCLCFFSFYCYYYDLYTEVIMTFYIETFIAYKAEAAKKGKYCAEHRVPDDYFCNTCNKTFCRICMIERLHYGHDVTGMDKNSAKAKEDKLQKRYQAGEWLKKLVESQANLDKNNQLLLKRVEELEVRNIELEYNQSGEGKVLDVFSLLSQQGNAVAQLGLGSMYEQGKGVTKDIVKAVEMYEKSAKEGCSKALERLGSMYSNGVGVKKDPTKAAEMYEKSAQQGQPQAQHIMGCIYEEGIGLPINLSKAKEWYEKSAQQGYSDAQCSLGTLYGEGIGVNQDLTKAFELFQKSAEQGNTVALLNLGMMYENANGAPQDFTRAVGFYEKSAQQGNADAQNNLGTMYEEGRGLLPDLNKAKEWYDKSAEQGCLGAQKNLRRLARQARQKK